MQIKKRLKLILLSALVCLCCLFVAFGFTMKSSTTASADTTPRYNVQFDYTNNKILSNLGNNTTTKYRSGTNVSTASVLDNDGTNMTFRIYAYGSDYSGSGILTNGGWIGSSTVNISFSSTYTDHTITVKDGSGKEIKKVTKATSIQLTGLTHGTTYNVEYLGFGLGTGSATLSTRYELTATFSFKVDLQNPTISGASTSMYEVMSNEVVTVNASDVGSGVKYIYKKRADAEEYTRYAGSLIKIYLDDGPGLYQFYAEDAAGRVSATYYAYYDAVLPVGKVYDENDNEITSAYYNGKFRYKATDEGFGMNYRQYKTPGTTTWQTYSESTWINATATNGLYTFRAIDLLGNVSEETTLYLDTVAPVGKVYANGTLLSSGGSTTASSLYYTATDTGGVQTCYVKRSFDAEYVEYANGATLTDSNSYSFYCVDYAGNQSSVYTVLMDHDAPTLSCTGAEFGSSTGSDFLVSAMDIISGCKLYYKQPNETSYTQALANSIIFPLTGSDGKYYFYAEDGLGNRTETVWIELSVSLPIATIIKSSTNNTAYATWDSSTITATLNGEPYTKGTLIYDEGNYTLKIVDSATGRENTYTFTISHLYRTVKTISPTCTAQGYTIYECISCGDTYRGDYTSAKGHNYSKTVYPASCVDQGYSVYTCTVCNYSYTSDIISAYGHRYAHEVIEATCTTQGYTINTCSVCGYSYRSDYVASLGHNYVTVSFDATCTEKGGIHYACRRCGDEYTVYTASALGHHYYEERVEQTCEMDGYIEHICTECDYRYKSDEERAFGHTYLTWVNVVASCKNEGNRIHKCETCGTSFVSVIPCLEHKYVITESETNGSIIRHYDCYECGYSYSEDKGNQYELVTSYVEYLYEEYSPYMIWVFLSTAGVWSIVMGVAFIIAYRNEDKLKAKQMLKNYVIGLIVIFGILVAMPYLVNGIAYLITH